ncbi:MAG TPA: TonB-dependent receptor [Vicinamibacterales bacterium]|nr:TonB-dependent receptor [Vicinamibacterales bacterium]
MHRLFSMLFALLLSAAVSSSAAAQTAGTISGIVLDASGAPIASATVSIEANGQTARSVQTGLDGRFTIEGVETAGTLLRVRADGFAETVAATQAPPASVRIVMHPRPLSESVTVTASRGAAGVDTRASTSVVSAAELLTSAAGAIDDALRNTPGFSLFRRSSSRVANPTTQGVTLRGVSGSGASRTLVVADGWALNDPFGSWVYWNRVPVAAVDRIEVVRGATGDLYGADALGGVIQVLTLDADRPRLRALVEGGSKSTFRTSGFGGRRFGSFLVSGGVEVQNTDGAYVVAEEARGTVDVPADSDYQSGFATAGYGRGTFRANVRAYVATEDRGNGTPLQVNDTEWRQVSGDANGALAGGYWTARITGGTQEYFQTFSAIAADRRSERLTNDQTIPGDFISAGGQWVRTWRKADVLVGAEGRRTSADINETRYPVTGAPVSTSLVDVEENNASAFGRIRVALRDDLSVVLGARGDHWESTESLGFFSPRASVTWRATANASLQFSISRAYRTPTLNELYRGFRVGNVVTNPNPRLDPERLTSIEGGLLIGTARASARVTAFHNILNEAISNVTLSSTPAQITRERQNTDEVGASGVELEGDIRPHPRVTLSLFGAFTSSHFNETPKQPAIEGNRVPQVPRYHVGAGVIADTPRVATFSAQARFVGAQFEDDLNELVLEEYVVVDASATRPITRALHLFVGVENLFDVEYDVARTPVRGIGWPRTVRAGVRLFLP